MDENNPQPTVESKKGSRTLMISGLILLFIVGLVFFLYARNQDSLTSTTSPTPTMGFDQDTSGGASGIEETEFTPTVTVPITTTTAPTSILTPTISPTKAPTPTGPGGFQSNATNTPTPTTGQLPLSN